MDPICWHISYENRPIAMQKEQCNFVLSLPLSDYSNLCSERNALHATCYTISSRSNNILFWFIQQLYFDYMSRAPDNALQNYMKTLLLWNKLKVNEIFVCIALLVYFYVRVMEIEYTPYVMCFQEEC